MPSIATPDASNGIVTASSATFESVAVTVIADPSSRTLDEEELKFTFGAVSSSAKVIVVDVPELAVEADPPLTEPMLIIAVSEPS